MLKLREHRSLACSRCNIWAQQQACSAAAGAAGCGDHIDSRSRTRTSPIKLQACCSTYCHWLVRSSLFVCCLLFAFVGCVCSRAYRTVDLHQSRVACALQAAPAPAVDQCWAAGHLWPAPLLSQQGKEICSHMWWLTAHGDNNSSKQQQQQHK
jgi:hypothetical protein